MEAAVVVPMEVEAEAASTVAVEAADSMEAVAAVFTAEAAERIAAAVVCTAAAEHRVTLLAAWAPMDAAAAVMRRVDTAAEHMAAGVPTGVRVQWRLRWRPLLRSERKPGRRKLVDERAERRYGIECGAFEFIERTLVGLAGGTRSDARECGWQLAFLRG